MAPLWNVDCPDFTNPRNIKIVFNFGEEEAPLEEDPETSSDDDVMLAEWFQAKAREGAAARRDRKSVV